MRMFETMFRMRRLEIAADMQYKAKMIRGFCHL
jgi:pyruvate dehydrogenase E1 component alpha subunit